MNSGRDPGGNPFYALSFGFVLLCWAIIFYLLRIPGVIGTALFAGAVMLLVKAAVGFIRRWRRRGK